MVKAPIIKISVPGEPKAYPGPPSTHCETLRGDTGYSALVEYPATHEA